MDQTTLRQMKGGVGGVLKNLEGHSFASTFRSGVFKAYDYIIEKYVCNDMYIEGDSSVFVQMGGVGLLQTTAD